VMEERQRQIRMSMLVSKSSVLAIVRGAVVTVRNKRRGIVIGSLIIR